MRRWCVAALLLAACGQPDTSPIMQPGNDCMSCHVAGGQARPWTVAGTVFGDVAAQPDAGIEGAQVIVTDDTGRVLTLLANSAGNFYTAEPLQFPITVQAEFGGKRMAMVSKPPSGSCNSCHNQPAEQDAPGRLFVPKN